MWLKRDADATLQKTKKKQILVSALKKCDYVEPTTHPRLLLRHEFNFKAGFGLNCYLHLVSKMRFVPKKEKF